MAQAKALDALEPFLALSKAATSPRAAADLVVQATSHPGTFVFTELLQTPQIQALATADPEHAAYLTLLQIFSYGTYADYEDPAAASSPFFSSAGPLPALSAAQTTKLRQLSLVSLATRRDRLGYAHLVRALRLPDDRALEALVISAVYAGLVAATLDPAHAVVRVSSVAPLRDLAPTGAVPALQAALASWTGRCETALAELDAQVAAIRQRAAAKADDDRRWNRQYNRAVDDEKKSMLNRDGGIGSNTMSSGSGGGERSLSTTLSNSGGGGGGGPMRVNKHRFMKRANNFMGGSGHAGGPSSAAKEVVEESMDIDDEDDDDDDDDDDDVVSSKRTSRRKL